MSHSAVPPADSSVSFGFAEDSEMTVHGSSNVRDWTMDVEQILGQVVVDTAGEGLPSIRQLEVIVPVRRIVASRSSMESKAHKALKNKQYPSVSFAASDIEVGEAQADSFSVAAQGEFTIAGETRPAEVTATGVRQDDGTYRVEGAHPLKLSTFNVERPSALFGALTVADEIRVTFDVRLTP